MRSFYQDRLGTNIEKIQKKSGVSLGVLGVGSDSSRADSYYHWGALNALVAMAEEGAYPSDML